MNKTIIINMNGIVFHIEEDAYEVLRSYMTEIKRHFGYSRDSDEIVTDIENRLAEMFNERLSEQGKQVIVLQDVEEITSQMGSVGDIVGDSEMDTGFDTEQEKIERKLFRDPDDKNIAGVCSGIAHYLNVESKWVRVAFVLSVLLSGIGLVLYPILWIIVPEARTRQEKMSMKGEPINLQSFKRNFDEEGESTRKNEYTGKTQNTGEGLGDLINNLINLIGRIVAALVKVIAVLVMVAGAMALFALIIALVFSLGFGNASEFNFFPLNVINEDFRSPLYLSAFLLLIIPLVVLISFAVKVIFNKKLISRTGGFALLMLWLTGLGMAVFFGAQIAADFKEEAKFEQSSELKSYPVYHLKLNANKYLSREDSLQLDLGKRSFRGNILIEEDHNEFNEIRRLRLSVEPSEDNRTILTKEFKARGGSFQAAIRNAQSIDYRFSQSDSTLIFDKFLNLSGNRPYRGQEIHATLKVPVGTRLRIDRDSDWHLANFNLWDCETQEKNGRWKDLIMTTEGPKCLADSISNKDVVE